MRSDKDRALIRKDLVKFKDSIGKLASLLSSKNVPVTFRGSECKTDGNRIVLPAVDLLAAADVSDEEIKDFIAALVGLVDHEVGHVLFSDMKLWAEEARRNKRQVTSLANAIEDAFIERRMREVWRGSGFSLDHKIKYLVNKDKARYSTLPVFNQLSLLICLLTKGPEYRYAAQHFDQRLVDWIDKHLAADIRKADDIQHTRDSIALAKKMYEKIKDAFKSDPPPKQKPQQQSQQQQGEGDEDEEGTQGGGGGNSEGDDDDGMEESSSGEDSEPGSSTEDCSDDTESSADASGEDDDNEAPERGSGRATDDGEDEEGDEAGGRHDDVDDDESSSRPDGASRADSDVDDTGGDEDEEAAGGKEGDDGTDRDEADASGDPDGSVTGDDFEEETEEDKFRHAFQDFYNVTPDASADGGEYTQYTTEGDSIKPMNRSKSEDWEELNTLRAHALRYDSVRSELQRRFGTDVNTAIDRWVGRPDCVQRLKKPEEIAARLTGPLRTTLERVLKARGTAFRVRDLEAGKLDRRRLHRLPTYAAIGVTPRVYSTTIRAETHNVAVLMAINESGSMGYWADQNNSRCTTTRMDMAAAAALALGDVLHALNIKFGIFGHTTGDPEVAEGRYNTASTGDRTKFSRFGDLKVEWVKSFSDAWLQKRTLMGGFFPQSNTYDAEVVRYGGKVLNDLKDVDRRILIMLDDGEPCPNLPQHIRLHANTLLATVPRVMASGVEVVGVGMASDAVKTYYPDHVIVHDLEKLPAVLLDKFGQLLGADRARRRA